MLSVQINSSGMNMYAKAGHDLHPDYYLEEWDVSSPLK